MNFIKATTGRKAVSEESLPTIYVLIAAIAFGGLITCMQACSSEEARQNEVEAVVKEFYRALDRRDFTDLKEVLDSSDFKNLAYEAYEDTNTWVQFCQPYSEIEIEIKDIDVREETAKVKVKIEKDNKYFLQTLKLELDEGNWLISRVDEMLPQDGEGEEEALGTQRDRRFEEQPREEEQPVEEEAPAEEPQEEPGYWR